MIGLSVVSSFTEKKLHPNFIIYYRHFLGTIGAGSLMKSSIHARLQADGSLDSFRQLAEKSINWNIARGVTLQDRESTQVQLETGLPPRKKRCASPQSSS